MSKLMTDPTASYGYNKPKKLTETVNSVKLPEIEEVKPFGTLVYVEMYSPQECMATSLDLGNSAEVTVNQGRVLAIGPRCPQEWGLKVGKRVFVSGGVVFGPDYGDYKFSVHGRKHGMVEYMSIKGEIVEKN